MNVGQKIRKLRIDSELTQEDVAKHLSVLSKTVSRYELGKSYPSYAVLHELADYFSVPMSYFVNDDDRYKQSKVEELISELIKEGIITDVDSIDKATESMIINAVKIDLAMKLKKSKG